MKLTTFIVTLFFLTGVAACVSKKKYDEILSEKTRIEAECKEAIAIARKENERLSRQIQRLTKDSLALEELKQEYARIKEDFEALETYYNNVLLNSGQLVRDLAEREQNLMALEESLAITRQRNEELERILNEKETIVQRLKEKVSDALLNFKENDLKVDVRNGKVYISLAEQLLFGSGSIKIDAKGILALQQLAGVIKGNEEISIMIEGHTDDVPVSKISQYMKDNWDLSVMRATAIVRVLTEAGVEPAKIIAAGRGEFVPVVQNNTPDGRQANRRTEIILTPRLEELFQILENN